MGMPPGFTNKRLDPHGTSNPRNGGSATSSPASSNAFSSTVPDVGPFFGPSSTSSAKDDFDSFLDDAVPNIAAPSIGGSAAGSKEVKHTPTLVRMEGLFLPYLPQDDAVASGLGAKDGGIDASEAQEVVDHLNRQLASLLCCSPPEFWKRVAMDESLDTFIDSYLHFRRRWYDDSTMTASRKQTAGVIVGDGDLSRRVFMLLYRMSSNQDPGVPSRQSLSSKEHAALLKDWKLLDLPKLLDLCAVYDHDNHALTSRLVSNVFKAQPSFASDLAGMVPPILGKIDTMHQRCRTMINSLRESEVDAVKQQLAEVVEYLNDVVITLDSFVGSYPPAAFILISAGATRDGIGMFLPALCALYEFMLPGLSSGFTNPSAPPQPFSSLELVDPSQVKRLKSRIIKFSWNILHACFLRKDEAVCAQFGDFPSLGGTDDVIKPVLDPESKGALLVQAAIAMTQILGETDGEGVLGSFVASNPGKSLGTLLRVIEKRQGLCEVVHELCQIGIVIMDDAQYDYFLSLVNRRPPKQASNPNQPKHENKVEDEEAVMLQSKVSQVKDLFPEYGDGFVALCLEAYDNDPEKVISCILEGKLHPDLDSLDRQLATKPSRKVEPSKDKGKGKAIEEPRMEPRGKGVVSVYNASGSFARLASEGGGTSVGREDPSSVRQPSATISRETSNSQASNANQGRYIRRANPDASTFNEVMDRRENISYSATVRAGKQYEYDDEYDDSFDDLAGTYLADLDEEAETENRADKTGRHSAPGTTGTDQSRPNRHHGPLKPLAPAAGNPREFSPSQGYGNPRTGQRSTSGGGHHTASGSSVQPRPPNSGDRDANSSARVAPSPHAFPGESSMTSAAAGASLDPGRAPPSQGASAGIRGGKTQRGRGKGKVKVDPMANFYLKDGKLYSYKVAGAEAGFASVEDYEASQIEEEELVYGLGAGGNVPAAMSEERRAQETLERKCQAEEVRACGEEEDLQAEDATHPNLMTITEEKTSP